MKFVIPKKGLNILSVSRRIGYIPQKSTEWDETAFIRPIGRDYPRFHLYVKEDKDNFYFNLHLDQKKPSYGKHTAHSGEYDGEVVETEMERIKRVFTLKSSLNAGEVKYTNKRKSSMWDRLFGR